MNYLVEPRLIGAGTCNCNCIVLIGSHDTSCNKTSCTSRTGSGDSCPAKQFCANPTGVKVSPTSIGPQSY